MDVLARNLQPLGATFVEVLRRHALSHPDKIAYIFLPDGETREERRTYAELDVQARHIAALLQKSLAPGERVLLLYPPGLEYIEALLGCWYAGVIAVPVYPPRPNHNLGRLEAILQDADAHVALTTLTILTGLRRKFTSESLVQQLQWIVPEQEHLAEHWQEHLPTSDTLALLQYTSGSTGTPKGVIVAHGNLIQNAVITQKGMELDASLVCASWLPAYHDMGLMGLILEPLYLGGSSILMAPASFLQQPMRWLQAISRFRANTSGAPNFAFDLCVRKATPEILATLDLSCWDVAFTGSEPIHAETLERFYQTFAACGLRREALYPCYGMAEATLFLAGGSKHESPVVRRFSQASLEQNRPTVVSEHDAEEGRHLVSCGRPQPGQRFLIVDPVEHMLCAPDQVGEIWIASPNVARGYWGRPQETQETFQAYLKSGQEGPFLRTGDLGFISEGELFVTGRLKDIIILRGRNIYPQDVEVIVSNCHPALRAGSCAAFSLSKEASEALVVVQEVDRHYQDWDIQEIIQAIHQVLANELDVEIAAIELVKVGGVLKTTSGKIQRRACRQAFLEGSLPVVQHWAAGETPIPQAISDPSDQQKQQEGVSGKGKRRKEEISAWLIAHIAERTHLDVQHIYTDVPFISFGLSSVDAIGLSGELEKWLGVSFSPTLIYDYPSIDTLVRYLMDVVVNRAAQQDENTSDQISTDLDAIAIIGLGCRFPGAENPSAFWQLLATGEDAISEVPAERWNTAELYASEAGVPNKMNTRWGGFLEQVESFDAHFFGISSREVEQLDPQQRLLLEVAWETFEQAGINPKKLAGSATGVFVGISSYDYALLQAKHAQFIDAYIGTGNAHSVAANRLSYIFDFRGPSLAIDTACSSSLVAVHQACQSLRAGDCTLAIAGGVNILLSPEPTIAFSQAHMMAADGRSKTFDEAADGYVRSEGCGLVLLKPLRQALQDGDTVLAVVRGSAINQDGASNGLTAPNGPAQEAVIRQACARAHVKPADIGYIETHGTGTMLGDPIEMKALKAVLMQDRSVDQPCLFGAVKSNIGHLEAAAGIASLIKTVLCLLHREIPPNLHLRRLNPYIDLTGTPFSIPIEKQSWLSASSRIAGVSAFGFGGTNAHIVVEEFPRRDHLTVPASSERSRHVLTLSAKSEAALHQLGTRYQHYLEEHMDVSLADLCFTTNTGRVPFAYRTAFVVRSSQDLLEKLSGDIRIGTANGPNTKIVFLFSGQGSSYTGMVRQLYAEQPVFHQEIDRCEQILHGYLKYPLSTLLLSDESQMSVLTQEMDNLQPVLFALEYALSVLWRSWGVQPDMVLGHSLGEYVAACVSGMMSLEDGLKLTATRGRLMQELPATGTMLTVFTDLEQLQQIFAPWPQKVTIAAINGPRHIVLAGPGEMLQQVVLRLEEYEIDTRLIPVPHAFHTDLLAPMLEEFAQSTRSLPLRTEHIPLITGLGGRWLPSGEVLPTDYWCEQTCNTVQFLASIQTAYEQGGRIFIEIGPSDTLTRMGPHCLPGVSDIAWFSSLKRGRDDMEVLLSSVAGLYMRGYDIDWTAFDLPNARTRLSLPTYPFERQRYWFIEASPEKMLAPGVGISLPYQEANVNVIEQKYIGKIGSMDIPLEKRVDDISSSHTSNDRSRKEQIITDLQMLLSELLHCSPEDISRTMLFLEMGADSIVLIDAVRIIEQRFGIKLPIRLLFGELGTLDALANHLDRSLPSETLIAHSAYPPSNINSAPATNGKHASVDSTLATNGEHVLVKQVLQPSQLSDGIVERIITHQLDAFSKIVAQQLEAARGATTVGTMEESPSPVTTFPSVATIATKSEKVNVEVSSPRYVAYQPLQPRIQESLTERQHQHMQELIARLTTRTQASKQYAQTYRSVMADNRVSAGFRFSIKEMLYPIVSRRSQGAYIWDLDGNRFLDVTMGFGVNLFGHNAPFIQEALTQQLADGFHLGPQSVLAGEVARLIHDITGLERVTFCNSGTEAVMTAVRIARAVSGKSKIVIFSGSYHGTFDGILARAQPQSGYSSMPMAPGVPQAMAEDVLVLDYGDERSLAIIQEHASELAAVLVEPVQSRHVDVQPGVFLQKLRTISSNANIALIFDETITGFRILPGGAQEWFGVKADLATYGKIVGGGMPIGVVAGKSLYMDSIDGGMWQYGDTSYPQAETTFFAGTFCKHPLAMATARAVLLHIKREGAALQVRLNERTARLVATLNAYFEAENVPMACIHFGSLFRFSFTQNMDLFFYHLLDKGVYIWEGRNCFLSTAHSDDDIAFLIYCVKESIREMREGGFLPPLPPSPPSTPPTSSNSAPSFSPSLTSHQAEAIGVRKMRQQEYGTGLLQHGEISKQITATLPMNFPLTDAQQQLWFASNLDEEGLKAYVERALLSLKGKLDYGILRAAFQMCIERHEALRTVFSVQGDLQQVLPAWLIEIPLLDFSAGDSSQKATRIEQWLQEEVEQGFDLVQGPLLRVSLLKESDEHHLLVIAVHHLVIDGLSIMLLFQEIAQYYTASIRKHPHQLQSPLQYREYEQWQRRLRQHQRFFIDEAYWSEVVRDPPPSTLEVLFDHPRPSIKTFAGAYEHFALSEEAYTALCTLGRNNGATPYMVLLATYLLCLHRLTGQHDIIVGVSTQGRSIERSETLMGYCVNVFPLRSILNGSPTFREYLQMIKQRLLDLYTHEDTPFAMLETVWREQQGSFQPPPISTELNLDRIAPLDQFGELHTEILPVKSKYAYFDLGINAISVEGKLHFEIKYNIDLFKSETVHRLMGSLQTLLHTVVDHAEWPIQRLPLLSASERTRIIDGWNQTRTSTLPTSRLHELITAQARNIPDRIALSFRDEQLSYGELERRASRMASMLKDQGVGSESLVAILAKRSIPQVVAILAVFKAEGAYIPLDPASPAQRISQILSDARPHLVLTTRELATQMLPTVSTPLCWLETVEETVLFPSLSWQQETGDLQQLAYVIYTSGSTGRPKGVMLNQEGMLNHLYAKIEDLQLGSQDCVAYNASSSFDISVWQMWAALLQGGRVHLFLPEEAQDPQQLWLCLCEQAITVLQLVPSALRLLVDELEGARPDEVHLRVLLATGEALPLDLCLRWWQRQPGIPLVNAYGPTECSDDVTHAWLEASRASSLEAVPIGRALRNTQLYVLDKWMELVPVGGIGELYVGGKGVGRGYLGAAERTGSSFVPDPWSREPGSRLYRTGDLVRYWEDGNLVYIGRVDEQVKVRGYRIELGEIEATLRTHPTVQEAVVMIREDIVADKCLVAYVVGEVSTDVLNKGALRQYMQEKLPDYMVPMYLIPLTALPLTSNGKVDRRALPTPDLGVLETTGQAILPQTPVEEIIWGIYRDVLGLEQISIDESFFNLGGHSLLATQVVSRIRGLMHIEVPLRYLFETPSVARLSQKIERMLQHEQIRALPPLIPVSREQDLPLSFAQERLWFLQQLEPQNISYHMPAAFRISGSLSVEIFDKCLQEMVQRHESLRTTFAVRSEQPVQIIHAHRSAEMSLIDLIGLDESKKSSVIFPWINETTFHPFDLGHGPLLRTGLFRVHDNEYIFYIVLHHILFDAWSTSVFLRELLYLYKEFMQGKPSSLAPLSLQYADFAFWQRGWLNGEVLDALVDYWTEQLRGAVPVELPTDRLRTKVISDRGTLHTFKLSAQLTQALKVLSRREGVTLFMTLLTAFQILLYHYTGQQDLLLGTDIANRTVVETEDMIGFFVNLLVLRQRLSVQATFSEMVKSVCSTMLDAYAHQNLPFEKLVDALQLPREPGHIPLVNVLFVMQNVIPQAFELPELTVSPLNIEVNTAKFDVALFLEEDGQELLGSVNYRTDLFNADRIEHLTQYFTVLLQNIVVHPDLPIEKLEIRPPEEKEQKLQKDVVYAEMQQRKLKTAKRRVVASSIEKPPTL